MEKSEIANYADDNTHYVIGDDIEKVICKLKSDYLQLIEWLSSNYMKDNQDKLQLLIPNNNDDIGISIGENDIKGSSTGKLLGIKIDNRFRFDDHVSTLCKKASQKLHALARVSVYMGKAKLKLLMKSFILSQFGYCPLIWMFHSRILNTRINRIHERALRLAYNDHHSSFETLLEFDKPVTIHVRNLQILSIEMYKIINGLAPKIMMNLLPKTDQMERLRTNRNFQMYNINSVYNGMETISFRGPKTWELVPEDIKGSKSLHEFKAKIRKWNFNKCACRICKTFIPNLGFI